MTDFPRKTFDADDIKLNNIYSNLKASHKNNLLKSSKIKEVYGDLLFEDSHTHRPLLHASFVCSMDGKINFNNQPNGSLIAKNNAKDPNGGLADFWVMNMLRATADGVIIGSGTLRDEPNITAHIFDKDLENDRLAAGKPAIPLNIIVSRSGKTIPFEHSIFKNPLPLMLITTESGAKYAKYYAQVDTFEIGGYKSIDDVEYHQETIINLYKENQQKLVILSCGEGEINNQIAMKILKILGLNYVSVEASHYTHSLIKEKMLDEIFLNYSGIYIGGNAMGIANTDEAFTSNNFPHMEMLSIHLHSPFFMYSRQRFVYD
ncbi:MAG: dihydrofolate reductase family protein [Alphaproteobacteria bacterium]|jgi:riboflavin biosynthesis pyrimidine reductase|nr:dihydrofolate reductase family protein [Alphaproteobacteria bacterium]